MGLHCQITVVRIDDKTITVLDEHTEKFVDEWNAVFLDHLDPVSVFPTRGQHEYEKPDPYKGEYTFGHTWVTREEIRDADYSTHFKNTEAIDGFRETFDDYFVAGTTHLLIHFDH